MEEMGMSDMQFKGYLRELIASLERARDGEDTKSDLDEVIARLKQTLED